MKPAEPSEEASGHVADVEVNLVDESSEVKVGDLIAKSVAEEVVVSPGEYAKAG